jgi:hypothetical protein
MKNKKNTPSKAKALAEKPVSPPAPVPEKPKSPAAKVAPHLYGRLLGIMKSRGAEEATESKKDFGATALAQMAPRNTSEVMLCSQMVATWEVGMSMLTASKQSTDFQSLEAQGNLAVKLLSVFERQFSALTKARKPLQVVTVEHVHKHLHVNAPGPTGVITEIEGQAHATDPRTLALAHGPALLGEDAPRDAVSVASDEARTLPNARRRTRDRRAER